MNFPTIFEILDRLSFLRGLPAVYMVLGTAVLIIMGWDWRLTLLALAGQYLVTGLLFVDGLDPRLAIIKPLTGLFVCLILYMTARQVNDDLWSGGLWSSGRLPVAVGQEEAAGLGLESRVRVGPYLLPAIPLRLLAALVMLLVVRSLAQRPGFILSAIPAGLDHLNLAVYGLAGMGLLGLGMTADPLRAGMGVFMFMAGFELYYSLLEQSVDMLAALAVTNLVLALAVTYLAQARYALAALAD